MTRELFLALALASPLAAQPLAQTPSADDKDLCGYLKDVEAKTDADCAPEVLAASKSKDSGAYAQKLELAHKRKPDVLKVYEVLKAPPAVNGQNQAALPALVPPVNERTFPAWLGPEGKDSNQIYARWLQIQARQLQQEKKGNVSPERQKQIDAALAVNQSKIESLGRVKDSAQFNCALGESCGTRTTLTEPTGSAATIGKAPWTKADYARENAQPNGNSSTRGVKLDGGVVPTVKAAASEALANTPMGPLADKPPEKSPSPFRTAGELALAMTGGLLLFGGLGGKALEQKFPGIQRNMGIVAAIGGTLAVGLMACPGLVATTIPLTANPASEEEVSEALATGQTAAQRAAQTASNLSAQEEEGVRQIGSQLATQTGRLLNAQEAQIDIRKFTEYALNPSHPQGMNKAKVFEAALGYTRDNFQSLVAQVRAGILTNPAVQGVVDQYGTRFTVDILVRGPAGQAIVRTGWIYQAGSQVPSMTTVFVR